MHGSYGVSQQTDEGYSEDPLIPTAEPSSYAVAYKSARDFDPRFNSLSSTSSAQLKRWMSTHLANLPTEFRAQLALELLEILPTSLVAEIVQKMNPRLYIDFVNYLPAEICLKILGYLDPISLLAVARTCKAWYSLAVDRKLWQTLYIHEGWNVIWSEVEAAEEMVNRRSAPGSMHRQRSEEDGHTHKKRAVSLLDDHDHDHVMTGVGGPFTDEPTALEGDRSVFGASPRSHVTPAFRDLNMQASGSESSSGSRKGKTVDKEKGKAIGSPTEMVSPHAGATSVWSGLWVWDSSLAKHRINWQYLYSMRRKLEINWEQGNFRNFQLPHPDHPEEGHEGECIYSLQYNEEYLVSGSRDKTLRIWNLATRRLVRKPLVGHIGSVLCLQFDSDPEEDIIVSGSSDSDVIIWKFSTGEIVQRLTHAHRESVLNVKFDKRILATCSKDRTIKIFNRRCLKPGEPGYVNSVPMSVRRYGIDDSPLDHLVLPPFTIIGVLEGHGAAVNAVQVVDNEVVSASGDRQIKVWDWRTGICKRTLVGHSKGIACVQYDGKRIVSGSSDNEVKVFDRETGIEVASLRGHEDLVRTVQAGFGDLPWSTEDDAAEAKRVDQAYMKALEDGEISSSPRRGRQGNAGSSDPDEITAYGAKLPPGGGGGKPWGRIVSGSYDKTIIIWRRDKTGKWKPKHHLKQEEAASKTARPPGPPGPGSGPGGNGSGGGGNGGSRRAHPSAATPSRGPVSAAVYHARASRGRGASSTAANASTASGESSSSGSGSSSRAAAGQSAPSQARAGGSRPRFSHLSQPINVTSLPPVQQLDPLGDIAQVTSPIIATITPSSQRAYAQLIDHIVPQGVHALQQALSSYPTMLTLQSNLQAAIDREVSPFIRSQLRQVVSAATVRAQVAQARARTHGQQTLAAADGAGLAGANEAAGVGNSANAAASGTGTSNVSNNIAGPPPAASAAAAAAAAAAAVAAAPGAPHRLLTHGPEVGMPTRIYKLQFDARRIICCSQTSVIVGWDFCNGDPALEEVSRFFATIE